MDTTETPPADRDGKPQQQPAAVGVGSLVFLPSACQPQHNAAAGPAAAQDCLRPCCSYSRCSARWWATEAATRGQW